MAGSDEELDFESMMAMDGVVAYGGGARQTTGGTRKGPSPGPKPATVPPSPPTPSAKPPPAPAAAKPARPSPSPELVKLRARVAAAEQRATSAEQRAAAAEEGRAAAEALVAKQSDELRVLAAERDGLSRRQHDLADKLKQARAELEERPVATDLVALFRRRGLATAVEDSSALRRLLDARPEDLLSALSLSDPQLLRQLLEDRLLLSCGAEQCAPEDDAPQVVVEVPSARCEICGGSNIRAKFRAFVEAAARAELDRIAIVGGSPAYRKKLRSLAADVKGLRLDLISGTQRRPKHKAEADMRRADVLIIWGPTLLDHSTSDNYRPGVGKARLHTVHERGITRMLDEVRQFIAQD